MVSVGRHAPAYHHTCHSLSAPHLQVTVWIVALCVKGREGGSAQAGPEG